jgi:hypothetical protein
VPRNGALAPTANLVEFRTYDGKPVVLADTGRDLRVIEWANGRWRNLGGPFRSVRANLGTEVRAAGQRPTLSILRATTNGGAVERVPYVLRAGRWVALRPLRGLASGPSVSGPLVFGRYTLMAHTQVQGNTWPFGVSRLDGQTWAQIGGTSLSDSAGASQGVLDYADGSAWAIWQDNVQAVSGFDTKISVARAGPTGPPSVRILWNGLSNGPGSLQALDAGGSSWLLYMPGRRGGHGEREVVVVPLVR